MIVLAIVGRRSSQVHPAAAGGCAVAGDRVVGDRRGGVESGTDPAAASDVALLPAIVLLAIVGEEKYQVQPAADGTALLPVIVLLAIVGEESAR